MLKNQIHTSKNCGKAQSQNGERLHCLLYQTDQLKIRGLPVKR